MGVLSNIFKPRDKPENRTAGSAYTLDLWAVRWEQSIQRTLLSQDEKKRYFVKFNLEGLLRGDYQSRIAYFLHGRV